jgi:hypothetical protein
VGRKMCKDLHKVSVFFSLLAYACLKIFTK